MVLIRLRQSDDFLGRLSTSSCDRSSEERLRLIRAARCGSLRKSHRAMGNGTNNARCLFGIAVPKNQLLKGSPSDIRIARL